MGQFDRAFAGEAILDRRGRHGRQSNALVQGISKKCQCDHTDQQEAIAHRSCSYSNAGVAEELTTDSGDRQNAQEATLNHFFSEPNPVSSTMRSS